MTTIVRAIMSGLLMILALMIMLGAQEVFGQGPTVDGEITATATTCTATACVSYIVQSAGNVGTIAVQITGTFVATLQFEGTVDNSTWVAISGLPVGSSTSATSATATGLWQFSTSGLMGLRVRASAYTSGTATVYIQPSSINFTTSTVGGTITTTLCTTSTCSEQVAGMAANGAAVAGNPVLVAGSDGTNARTLTTDSSGRTAVIGAGTAGTAVVDRPVIIGVSDGTNARSALGDSSGRIAVVGAATSGTAVVDRPVLVGGSDGTTVRSVIVDNSGRAVVVGATTVNTAVAGNPVLGGVSDGTNVRNQSGDQNGRAIVVGAATTGTTVAGSPVYMGGIGSTSLVQPIDVSDTGASITVSAGTTTLLVTGVASQRILVTGYMVSLSAAGTVQFISGGGVNCASSPTNLTPAVTLATGTPMALGNGIGVVLRTAADADNLCLAAVTGNAGGHLRYLIR